MNDDEQFLQIFEPFLSNEGSQFSQINLGD